MGNIIITYIGLHLQSGRTLSVYTLRQAAAGWRAAVAVCSAKICGETYID